MLLATSVPQSLVRLLSMSVSNQVSRGVSHSVIRLLRLGAETLRPPWWLEEAPDGSNSDTSTASLPEIGKVS